MQQQKQRVGTSIADTSQYRCREEEPSPEHKDQVRDFRGIVDMAVEVVVVFFWAMKSWVEKDVLAPLA